jgi:probable HAF family extracellular repeat protein
MTKILGALLLSSLLITASTSGVFTFGAIGNYPNAFQTYPRGLNGARTIVGFYLPKGGFQQGYMQTGKNYRTIAPPGVLSSYLEGINDKGVAVGGYCDTVSCNPEEAQHGFRYNQGRYTKIDYPAAGTSLAAEGINNLGQVVGGYCQASAQCPIGFSPSNHAFLLDNGVFTTLDYPGALGTLAYSINDSGSIVGLYEDSSTMLHGYLYDGAAFTTLDFPNANWTIALGINNIGTVSGIYEDNTTLITHGFTYANGVFTRIDVPNSTATGVGGINNKGDVTATANVNNLSTPFVGVARH